jgi:hypothetical protein
MRVPTAIAAMLSASLAMASPADAGPQKKVRKSDSYSYRAKKSDYYNPRTYEDSADCIRAEGLDPAGDYKAYPCWARKAFSPKAIGGGR